MRYEQKTEERKRIGDSVPGFGSVTPLVFLKKFEVKKKNVFFLPKFLANKHSPWKVSETLMGKDRFLQTLFFFSGYVSLQGG